MAIKYNQLNVDEKYSGILEPNLYYNNVLVPGVTCTDKYKTGRAYTDDKYKNNPFYHQKGE